jgi:metal-dependent HD superfamily phosphatase/phosphodiesterase
VAEDLDDVDIERAGARSEQGVSLEVERSARMAPAEAVAGMRIRIPVRGNRTLREILARANGDDQIKALWHVQNVNAARRLQINDHSWVHIQVVSNIALKLLRDLARAGAEPGMVTEYGMRQEDAEVVVILGCLLHCVGMAIHRRGHEDWSLFLAWDLMPRLLEGLYEEPERTIVMAETLQTITSHRADGRPLTLEAGIVRVADALDMAKGRSRIPFEAGRVSMHSLSAAAIDGVRILPGGDRPVLIEIEMNNSAGIYQVDELLKPKLRGSGLEPYVEVVARIEEEAEKRLVPVFRL